MLGIIGGSGLTELANLDISHREVGADAVRRSLRRDHIRTVVGAAGDVPGAPRLRPRSRRTGELPRQHLGAVEQRARGIVSVASVGGIRADLSPGDLVVPHQIIDYTWGRRSTYHEGEGCTVTHVDFTEPYDRNLRQMILLAASDVGVPASAAAVRGDAGPRLETAAEIDRLERDGCDVVGMTGMPEAVLARELGVSLCGHQRHRQLYRLAGRQQSRRHQLQAIEGVLHEGDAARSAVIERLSPAGVCTTPDRGPQPSFSLSCSSSSLSRLIRPASARGRAADEEGVLDSFAQRRDLGCVKRRAVCEGRRDRVKQAGAICGHDRGRTYCAPLSSLSMRTVGVIGKCFRRRDRRALPGPLADARAAGARSVRVR